MPVYNIAGLHVLMEPKGTLLQTRAKKYLAHGQLTKEQCDIIIDEHSPGFAAWQEKYKAYSYAANEYAWFGYRFYSALPMYGGFFLHASAVALDGAAYLFQRTAERENLPTQGCGWIVLVRSVRRSLTTISQPFYTGTISFMPLERRFQGKTI